MSRTILPPQSRLILCHLGLHGWLLHDQLQELMDSNYHSVQRQIRLYLMPKEGKQYIERVYLSDGRTPIFRLSKTGKRYFKKLMDHKEALRPRYRVANMKHGILTNWLIIHLKKAERIAIDGFELEPMIGLVRPDAVIQAPEPIYLEVDRGTEAMDYIIKKWRSYETEAQEGLKGDLVFWYCSSKRRADQIKDWIDEVQKNEYKNSKLHWLCISPPHTKIIKAVVKKDILCYT